MRIIHLPATALLSLAALALAACSGDGYSSPTQPSNLATVQIELRAPTTTDPAIAQQFPVCVNGVNVTHIHPSWRSFSTIPLTAVGADRWTITFNDVPVGSQQSFRINDPNACDNDPNGATTDNIFANGVRLTRIVGTPGNGTEPGLAFTVAANGTVTP